MSYVHWQKDVTMLSSAGDTRFTCTTSGIKGSWSPGLSPVQVRYAGVVALTSILDPIHLKVNFWKTSVYPSTTSTNWTAIGTVFLTSVNYVGKCVYVEPTSMIEVQAPAGILAEVETITSGSVLAEAHIFVEPSWDNPVNIGTCGYVATTTA